MERKNSWKSDLILKSRKDPVFFIENVLGNQLWEKQKEICYALVEHERVAIAAAFGLGKCFDKHTEILTEERGWQLFKKLLPTDKVATLVNGCLEFVQPEEYYEGFYEGEMIGCRADQLDFLVTPNHRCYVVTDPEKVNSCNAWHIEEAQELLKYDAVYFNQKVVYNSGVTKEYCQQQDVKAINSFIKVFNSSFYTIPYCDQIYCVKVPTGILLVRRNGLYHWSGNTFLAARLVLWWLYSFPNSRVVSTAPCFDDATEILTDSGWKYFKDLNKTEKVASLVDGHLQMVTPLDWMVYPVEGDLIGYKGNDLDFLVTPHHKLHTKQYDKNEFELTRADKIYGKWGYQFSRNCVWEGVKDNLTEQDYKHYGFWVATYQTFHNTELGERKCPRWLLNATKVKLQAFLRGYISVDNDEQEFVTTITVRNDNKNLADALQEIGLKAGYVVDLRWYIKQENAIEERCWVLDFSDPLTIDKKFPITNQKNWYKKSYQGNVYCVEVPSNILLVRRNGIYHWSGNTQRQIKDLLWAELRTAHNKALVKLGGELFQMMLKISENHFAVGFSTDAENIDKFTGWHAPNQLVVFDQAGGIAQTIWEGAEGLMTSANCRWLAISNTAISSCELANICMPDRKTKFGKWEVIRIKATETPNVLAGRNIFPGLIAHDWVQKREEAWGRDDPLYKIFVEAEFIPDSEMVVVPFEFITKAFDFTGELGAYIEVGLDIARKGTDSTVWVARSGSRVLEIKRVTGNTTMQVVGETIEFKRYLEQKYSLAVLSIKADVIGLGAGVYDRLVELDEPAVPVNNAEVNIVIDKERYSNVRAEMAWAFRQRMEQFGVGFSVMHVSDYEIKEYVRGDIQAIRYKITSQGKIQILQKDEIRKNLGRSPDYWDALVLAFESPGGGPPAIECLSDDKKEEELSITEDEWQILLGNKAPVDHYSFNESKIPY